MKAVLLEAFGGPENLHPGDAPDPVPGPGEALLKVRACALNHLDIWVRGGIPAYRIRLPHILGSDIAGTVVSGDLSRAACGLQPGARVVVHPGRSCGRCEACAAGLDNQCHEGHRLIGANGGPGGYAQYVAVPAQNLLPAPEGLSDEQAAAFPLTYLTAWHMLITQAGLRPGQTLLVLGAGSGVGVAAIQLAAMAGSRVLAASTSKEKLERAKALGAHGIIHSPPEDLQCKTLSLTGGRGADVVFEHVGPAMFGAALKSLRPGGTLVTCGATSGPTTELDLRYVFSRELRILGAKTGTLAEFHAMVRAVTMGRLEPVVDSTFPLAEAGRAHEYLASARQFGKVVLKI